MPHLLLERHTNMRQLKELRIKPGNFVNLPQWGSSNKPRLELHSRWQVSLAHKLGLVVVMILETFIL